jgi:two-component system response regulator WspF
VKVAIVNDLALACEALRRAVATDPSLEVAWIARDGEEAVEKARASRPDIVLMDLLMPRMDGVAATREIMRVAPCPILVVTATVSGNATLVYEALGAGALDAVNTPTLGGDGAVEGAAELLRRIHLVERVLAPAASRAAPAPAPRPTKPRPAAPSPPFAPAPPLVAIGASTGGPRAVAAVLRAIKAPVRAAILVVQHVSHDFVAGYADWLHAETGHRVSLASPGLRPAAGEVVVADGRRHLVLGADGRLDCTDAPAGLVHRPSVDVLFRSLAAHARPGVAVLLTGMGRDGAEGMAALRAAGWHTIAQDEATSVVWGMPGAAVRLGAARDVLPVDTIGEAVSRAVARAG